MLQNYVPELYPRIISQNYAPELCSRIMFQNYIPELYLRIMLQNYAPELCSRIMFQNYVPELCSRIMFQNYVPELCSRIMFQNYVPELCPRIMFQNYVPELCSRIISQNYVPELCSRIMFQNYAPELCSRIMFQNYVPELCSKIMFQNYVPELCSRIIFQNYVPELCSRIMFQNYVSELCSRIMFQNYVSELCSRIMFQNYVPELCSRIIFQNYVPELCSRIMSQNYRIMFQNYVRELCSRIMFQNYVPELCSRIIFQNYVPELCSRIMSQNYRIMFQNYVPELCSRIMFQNYVPELYSRIMFQNYAPELCPRITELCSRIMFQNYVPELCSRIMFQNYVPELCSRIISQNYVPELCNQTDNDPQATKKPPSSKTPKVTKIPKVTKKPGKKRKPSIKFAEGPATVPSQHHHVSLKCKAGGKPLPHVDWYKNGKPIIEIPHRISLVSVSTNKDNKTTLLLTHPSHSDSGVYTCVASNSEGTARRNVTLSVPKDWKERCPKGDGYCFNGGTCQIIPALNGGSLTENMFCINIDVSVSNVDVSASNVDVSASNVDVSASKVDVSASNVDVSASNVDVSASNVDVSASNVDVSASNVDVSASNVDVSASNVDVSASNVSSQYLSWCPRQFRGERCEEREADKSLFETTSMMDIPGANRMLDEFSISGQATLYHQRTLIILGIIIAVLVFIVICIASYILANQKRKHYEKCRKRNEAAKSAKQALTEKENDIRRVTTGPPQAPFSTTVTDATDGRILTTNSLSEFPQLRRKPNGIAGEPRRRLEANSDYDNLTEVPATPKTTEMFSKTSSHPSIVDNIGPGQTVNALPLEPTSPVIMSSSPVTSRAPVTDITISPKTEQASASTDLEDNSAYRRTFEAKSVQDLTRPIQSNVKGTNTSDPLNSIHHLKQAKVPHSQTFPIPSVLKSPPGSDSDEDNEEIPYQRHQDNGEDNLYIIEDTNSLHKSFDKIFMFSPENKNENTNKGEMRKYQSEEGPSPVLQNCSLPSHKSNRSYSLDDPSNGKISRETDYLSPDGMVSRSLLTDYNAYDPLEDDKPWDVKYYNPEKVNKDDRYKLTDGLLPNQEAIPL
ncbi:hypothetical protein Btru_045598 [Bulinus truncatus]|nr:hypothetical protein Btru_045598 [Bulinus truncatus]